jgi:hypothetical protein
MKSSEMAYKLIASLKAARDKQVMDGLNPVSPGIDPTYEFGRRIGNRIGMDYMILMTNEFFKESDEKDKDL